MPLQIQRAATVYRMWVNDDVKELCVTHAAAGWLVTQTWFQQGDDVIHGTSLQKTATNQLVTATDLQVVVSDLVTVSALSVEDYNRTYSDQIEVEL